MPLQVQSEDILHTQVFNVTNGAGAEATELVEQMTAYLTDQGHINTTINSFQAEKIGHQVFKLTAVYAGYDSVRQLYTTDMPEWDMMWGRLM